LLPNDYQLNSIATDDFTAQSLKRIDKQLLAMINDAKDRLASEQYSIAEQVHMSGFSAAATFCNRFALLHPSKVQTTTTGGSVVLPLPKDVYNNTKIRYPLGTADYNSITDRKFDFSSWKDTDRFVFLGKEDRPEPDSSSYWYGSLRYEESVSDVYGKKRVTERFPFVRSQYKKISPDRSEFKLFSGAGHSITTEMEQDVIEYHQDTATASGSVSFTSPSDGATVTTPVLFEMTAENFTVEAASNGVRDGAGHLHILVDQPALEPGTVIPNNESSGYYHYGDGSTTAEISMEPGTHTVRVQAGDAKHRAYDLTDTIQLSVEQSTDTGTGEETIENYRNSEGNVEIEGLRGGIDDFTSGDIDIDLLRQVINEFTQ